MDDSGTINLFWENSETLNGVFKERNLQIKFDGAAKIDADIALYMFCSVIIPCYATLYKHPISVTFNYKSNESIPAQVLKYFDISNFSVHIGTTESPSFQFGRPGAMTHALFYGGGKDSSLSAAIHADLYGAENTTLFRLVWDADLANLPRKKKIISEHLATLKAKGFDIRFVESNFHGIIESREIGKSANFALYPGLMAPALAAGKYVQAAHGYDGSEFHFGNDSTKRARFALVRPAAVNAYASVTGLALKRAFSVRNFNYGIGPVPAFKLLSSTYPEYFSNIYMCERLGGKWCLKCRKCFTYALACLANQEECDFNLGYYFENSKYVQDLVTEVESAFGEAIAQTPPQVDKFAHKNHTCAIIELASQIDPTYARQKLWHKRYRNSFLNLVRIIEPFHYYDYPDHSKFWLRAFEEDQYSSGIAIEEQQREKRILLDRCAQANVEVSYAYEFTGVNTGRVVSYRYGDADKQTECL
ncbi:hypothetical protein [Achromobacter spanius]|uniref:hypothetical protein n=1 Tax=Achromobacter spanius TaxID=217203 RepID=UPI00131A3649|nr:hypothetical protein [Achromobacter spanius]